MNVLVTGATGFIGNALCAHMVREGFGVKKALRENPKNSSAEPVIGEINGETNWTNALLDCDSIIHLAARAHVMRDTAPIPLTAFRAINTFGTLNLAKQAIEHGIRRFVFVSSIGVNGNRSLNAPFTESDTPAPQSPYAISKFEAELGLLKLAEETRMELVIIRPPLVYGPGAPGNFASLIRWVHRQIPLPLGSVHNKRSFIYLDNLIDLILTCLRHPRATHQLFLAGDGDDLSTTDLIYRLGLALGKPARLIPVPIDWLRAGAIILGRRETAFRLLEPLQIDISKACKWLGWTPPVDVNEGLRRTAEAFLHPSPRKHSHRVRRH